MKSAKILVVLLGVSLSKPHSARAASRIDADFYFKQKLRREGVLEETRAQNSVEYLYKNFLGRSMYSECQWYPSDSQLMNLATRHCGAFRGTLLAISRFMIESEAHKVSSSLVHDYHQSRLSGLRSESGRIRFQWYNFGARTSDFGVNPDFESRHIETLSEDSCEIF